MYNLKALYTLRCAFNSTYNPEFIYYFNSSSEEAQHMFYPGFYVYTGSQLCGIFYENTIVLMNSAYNEQNSFFLSGFGYLQKSNKVLSAPAAGLEAWKINLLVFVATLRILVLLFSLAGINSSIMDILFRQYFDALTTQTLFSYKVVPRIVLPQSTHFTKKLLFVTPFVTYTTNFYLDSTLTRLSKFMALCSDKARVLYDL